MAAMASSIDGHPISLKAPGFFPCPFHRGSILQSSVLLVKILSLNVATAEPNSSRACTDGEVERLDFSNRQFHCKQ